MAKKRVPDFSGWATKNDLKCADGRTIRRDAFKDNDGKMVPLVWQHAHDTPSNVLGHALLENRKEGVYAWCFVNETESGINAKTLVQHGDITALSIYANQLQQNGQDVLHGYIREVSLVLSPANPGAIIDNVSLMHGDGSQTELEDEAVIYTGLGIDLPDNSDGDGSDDTNKGITHADDGSAGSNSDADLTVEEVFNSMTPQQQDLVYAMVAAAVAGEDDGEGEGDQSGQSDDSTTHSDTGGSNFMKHNVFSDDKTGDDRQRVTLTHDEMRAIFSDAVALGSLKKAVLKHDAYDQFIMHAGTYGIDNIDYLFPDARAVRPTPDLYMRDNAWVNTVINGAHHSPFSRIKSLSVDLTTEQARALGYVTGDLKVEEVIALARRITTPQTIYKKQKLDRDDIVDIVDMDVVAWLKMEMRLMLNEELARAVLISDGRAAIDDYKIQEDKVRPIYLDADTYTIKHQLLSTADLEDLTDAFVLSRATYKGSGNPTAFIAPTTLANLLLQKDTTGRRLYETEASLAAACRVSRFVEVPLMEGLSRTPVATQYDLKAIIVNMTDYTIGADKGGQVNLFEDFDIDYNQEKYLLETRVSGTLTRLLSAIVIEQDHGT